MGREREEKGRRHYSHNQKYLRSAIFVLEIRIWDLRAGGYFCGKPAAWAAAARAPSSPLATAAAAAVSCLGK